MAAAGSASWFAAAVPAFPALSTRPAAASGSRTIAAASLVASAAVVAFGYAGQTQTFSGFFGGGYIAPGLDDAMLWGKHDRRSKKGKRYLGNFGKVRPRKPKASPWSQEFNGGALNWAPEGSSRPGRNPGDGPDVPGVSE